MSGFLNPLLGKALVIGGLTLVLFLPLSRLQSLISERTGMRELATRRVADGWGAAQLVGAPVLSVPVEVDGYDRGRKMRRVSMRRMLAASAEVRGELEPELRHVGIYTVPVYRVQLHIGATFAPAALASLRVEETNRTVRWDEAVLFVPVGDLRGIREIVAARWGEQALNWQPAAYDGMAGVVATIDVSALRAGRTHAFLVELELAGSGRLHVLPLARVTTVNLRSSWPHPGFDGAYLPVAYTLDTNGFDARWRVLELNRSFPQTWNDQEVGREKFQAAAFGVSLFQPVDTYHRNERALKYAVLFIALTFMSIFLWEHGSGARIHAMQYLFVGLALCVFYLLLLALSEHVAFGRAYLIAAAAQAVLIGLYLGSGLSSRRIGVVVGAALGTIYGLLYLLILSEQYALLFGAVLTFTVLAVLMLATRRTDWYLLSGRAREAIADR